MEMDNPNPKKCNIRVRCPLCTAERTFTFPPYERMQSPMVYISEQLAKERNKRTQEKRFGIEDRRLWT